MILILLENATSQEFLKIDGKMHENTRAKH